MSPLFAPAAVVRRPRPGGGFVLQSPRDALPPERCLGDLLVRWAHVAPSRPFLCERVDGRWQRTSYAEALRQVRGYAQTLLDAGLGPSKPLALLSGNSVTHALLTLAAMHVGVPVAPISPAYSLASTSYDKLRAVLSTLAPGAVWAEASALDAAFDAAFAALQQPRWHAQLTEPTAAVDEAFAALDGDRVAKILFSSGSTGAPKGVVNTQRMLCANQAAITAGWPCLTARPPVIVDWLPWSHTFGGNHNFNLVLTHGGTLYLDGGRPLPGAFATTVANLREVPSTLYFNVPRGFDLLVGELERDAELRATFFAQLDLVFYAAAALSPSTWERLAEVARRAGAAPAMVSAWGSTETAPLVTQVHFAIDRAGVIGLPAPGVELAFAPVGDKLEMRVKGPSVTPGYWRAGVIEPLPVDALGFYPMGDAGRLADDDHPEAGVVFDGRIAENFKLASGTWVHVGALRLALVAACAPLLADAAITGHDRDEVGALLFAMPGQRVDDAFRRELARGLERCNQRGDGASVRIARALLLDEPPSIDAGEMTDKGYLNQRAVLDRRAAAVDALYDERDAAAIIRPAP